MKQVWSHVGYGAAKEVGLVVVEQVRERCEHLSNAAMLMGNLDTTEVMSQSSTKIAKYALNRLKKMNSGGKAH